MPTAPQPSVEQATSALPPSGGTPSSTGERGSAAPATTSSSLPSDPTTSSVLHPRIDLEGCATTANRSGAYATEIRQLFGRQPPQSFQVIGDRLGSLEKPFAIALRYTTGIRLSPTFTSDLQINGRPARIEANVASGRLVLSWLLPDGSEAYLRSDTFTLAELLEVAEALVPRELSSAVPGFEIMDDDDGLAVLDETAGPFEPGTLEMSECSFPNGPSVRASVLGPRPLWQAAYLLDRPNSPALVFDLADGRVLALTGSQTVTLDLLAEAAEHIDAAGSDDADEPGTDAVTPAVQGPLTDGLLAQNAASADERKHAALVNACSAAVSVAAAVAVPVIDPPAFFVASRFWLRYDVMGESLIVSYFDTTDVGPGIDVPIRVVEIAPGIEASVGSYEGSLFALIAHPAAGCPLMQVLTTADDIEQFTSMLGVIAV